MGLGSLKLGLEVRDQCWLMGGFEEWVIERGAGAALIWNWGVYLFLTV